jgi:hypothetical protein
MSYQEPKLVHAKFVHQSGVNKGKEIEVQFNPSSLHYELTNTLDNKGHSDKTKQIVSQTSAKLTLQLVFDQTHDGQDVRQTTEKIAALAAPRKETPPKKDKQPERKVIPVVSFEWGLFKFQGVVESFKEGLDFFSPDGVPLRSTVDLTLTNQDRVFQPGSGDNRSTNLNDEKLVVPSPGSSGAADAAKKGGDAGSARDVGAANGQDSLRFSDDDALVLDFSVDLGAPVAFASGGFGIGVSGGFGLDISGGFGLDISGGFGLDFGGGGDGGAGGGAGFALGAGAAAGGRAASPAAGRPGRPAAAAPARGTRGTAAGRPAGRPAAKPAAPRVRPSALNAAPDANAPAAAAVAPVVVPFGSRASAGVSASEGAFVGLRAPDPGRARIPRLRLDPFLEPPDSAVLGTDGNAGFEIGGRAIVQGPVSLRTDVGAQSLRTRIQFDEE